MALNPPDEAARKAAWRTAFHPDAARPAEALARPAAARPRRRPGLAPHHDLIAALAETLHAPLAAPMPPPWPEGEPAGAARLRR